jgi:two-component system, sensor histidine kinase and response regulator
MDKVGLLKKGIWQGQDQFSNIIHTELFRQTLKDIHKSTGVGIVVLDTYQNVFLEIGIQKVCKTYHKMELTGCNRLYADFIKRKEIKGNIESHLELSCNYGFSDIVVPININGKLMGFLFYGHFYYNHQTIDEEKVEAITEKYGYDLESYIEALREIPIISKTQIQHISELLFKTVLLANDITVRRYVEDNLDHLDHMAKQQLEMLKVVDGLVGVDTKYMPVINAMNEGLVLMGLEGRIMECNFAAESILGLTRDQIVGTKLKDWQCIHEDGSPFPDDLHPGMVTLRTGEPQKDILMGVGTNHNTFSWIQINTIPLYEKDNEKPSGAVALFTDITHLKEREEEIRREKEFKNRLFAIIAHDLREPLGAIKDMIGYTIKSLEESRVEESKKFLRAMQKTSKNAFQLISQLLEWSRVQLKKIETKREYIRMDLIVDEVLEAFHTSIRNKELSVKIAIEPFLIVYHDKHILATILRNLVSNAIKFSHPEGIIVISAHRLGSETNISIHDQGIGMTEKEVEALFDASVVHSKFGTNNEKGYGLGLSTCRELLALTGDHISLESQPGQGSRFVVHIAGEKA